MKWIKTGRQIGQTVKNVQRMRQIIAVFAKYGFVDVVQKMKLERFLPSSLAEFSEAHKDRLIQERLRMAFEELGPTFVKLGQVLSMRSDLLPEAFLDEFKKLQDNVQPLPFEVIRDSIQKELGRSLSEAFAEFDEKPLAAASIGQVHKAVLHSGEKVVVKIQRPEIGKAIENDISLLALLAAALERYVPETRIIGPKIIVEEFFRTLTWELDFKVEANNMQKMAENLAVFPEVAIPKVYKHLSTHRVLTQERFEGIRVNDIAAMDAAGIDRKHVVSVGARAFFKSIMIDGVFHGDLHGGNLFILPGNRLGMIDFGIVGRLSDKSKEQLANMVMSLMTEDYENLCYQYAELGAAGPSIDFDGFTREVRNTLSPYMGLSLSEINAGKILIEATKIATKYNIKVPGDWMLVFKAIVTVEGMGRTLDPDFDLLSAGNELVRDLIKNQYSVQKLTRDALWIAKDLAALLQVLPRQLRWMFRKLASNDFALEVRLPQIEDVRKQMDVNGRRTSSSILAAGLFVASALALQHTEGRIVAGYPLLTVVFFGMGLFVLVRWFMRTL